MAKATYIGTEAIVNGWKEKAETPFFSLWVKSVKCEQNTVNDWDKAEEKLTNQINDFVKEGYSDILILKLHPEKKASYTAKEDAVSMYCQAVRSESPSIGYMNPNQAILEKLNAIESRINAIEGESLETDDDDDDESAEVGKTEAMLESINGILNHPVTNLLINYLQLPAVTAPPPPPAALAGTEVESDQAELETALTTLFKKGVTVEHIKKLAAMPAPKIKMLISML